MVRKRYMIFTIATALWVSSLAMIWIHDGRPGGEGDIRGIVCIVWNLPWIVSSITYEPNVLAIMFVLSALSFPLAATCFIGAEIICRRWETRSRRVLLGLVSLSYAILLVNVAGSVLYLPPACHLAIGYCIAQLSAALGIVAGLSM